MNKQHFSKNLPYNNTTIDVSQTMMDIHMMLKQADAKGIRWTDTPEAMRGVELPLLEFLMESTIEGVKKEILIRVQPRLLTKQIGSRHNKRTTSAPEQSMRMLYWWLKSKLEAVKYGLESVENVLLSNIVMNLPDGKQTTVGQTVIKQLLDPVQSTNLLPSFDILTPDEVRKRNEAMNK